MNLSLSLCLRQYFNPFYSLIQIGKTLKSSEPNLGGFTPLVKHLTPLKIISYVNLSAPQKKIECLKLI